MTDHLTEEEIIAAVPGLTRVRLSSFIEMAAVIPLRREADTATRHVFRRVDVARVQLLCELADDLELDEAALEIVLTLLDQLHAARSDLRAIARAVQAEPQDVRARIGLSLVRSRG